MAARSDSSRIATPTMHAWPSTRPSAPLADASARQRVLLAVERQPVEAEQRHHAEDRSNQPTEIEHLVVADVQQLGEDQESDDRAAELEQHRRDEAHLVAARHEQPAQVARDDSEDDRTNHS